MSMMTTEYRFVTDNKSDNLPHDLASAARCEARVLLSTEPGADVRAVASLIHHGGRRAHGPFLSVRCAGAAASALEARLFGRTYVDEGGSVRHTRGCLERADGGTLLVADVDALDARLQARLLQFLDTGEVRRVGADRAHARVDVRLIVSAAPGLFEETLAARFREDLFYRLNTLHLLVSGGGRTTVAH
jgi:DNA-binding NtrC family response regulator